MTGLLFNVMLWAQSQVVVDPNAVERTVAGSFDAITVSGGIDLYLSQSNNIAIAVSAANENIRAGIKTVVEDGILKIYYDGPAGWRKRDRKLRAYVSFTELKKLNASGGCDVVLTDSLTGISFDMDLSGISGFNGSVYVKELKINLSGFSDITISGKASSVEIDCSGSSDVNGYELVTDACHVNASGTSDIKITVNKELKANASGASNVFYKGDAVVKEKHTSGSSDVSKKDE